MGKMFALPARRLLHGHVSEETAYVVGDYPYGGTLRCKIRYWVQRAGSGPKKDQERFVSQTTNPKAGGRWNNPHPGIYHFRTFLYVNQGGYVKTMSFEVHGMGPYADARWRLTGAYDQLNDAQRGLYLLLRLRSQRYAAPWREFAAAHAALRAHLAEHGTLPTLDSGENHGHVEVAAGRWYIRDWTAMAAAVGDPDFQLMTTG